MYILLCKNLGDDPIFTWLWTGSQLFIDQSLIMPLVASRHGATGMAEYW